MTLDEFRRRLEVESKSLRGQAIRARIDRGVPAATGHGMSFYPHTIASTS